jgi:hypothetical protein
MSCYRYPADFLGPLAIIAALAFLDLSYRISRPAGVLLACVGTYSLFAVAMETFSIAKVTENFDLRRPSDFERAA